MAVNLPSRRVADLLRARIADGTYPPGSVLPSERALAVEHGIARNTAREAVRLLAAAGLVTARQGLGVFVADQPAREVIPPRLLQELRDGQASMQDHADRPGEHGDPVAAIRGWAWWLDQVLNGDY